MVSGKSPRLPQKKGPALPSGCASWAAQDVPEVLRSLFRPEVEIVLIREAVKARSPHHWNHAPRLSTDQLSLGKGYIGP